MIGRLRGIIAKKLPPELLLDVGGVFYELQAPMSSFYQMPDVGETATLHIHMVVREDAQKLYAFASEAERQLFRSLIKVNGVGPKLGLTILSGMEHQAFIRCVQNDDISSLTRIPGIGKKTAERLLMETRDTLSSWQTLHPGAKTTANPSEKDDAIAALSALGYKPQQAKQAIQAIDYTNKSSEEIIRLALKEMVS